MDEQNRQELTASIKKAFAKVKKPAKNAARSDNDELQDIVGKNWDKITPNELSYSFMVFFTAAGLHYYLQAYLIAAILYPEKMEQPIHIIFRLSPSPNLERFATVFSCEQMKVIVAFFELYRELYPAEESLINSRTYIREEKALEQGWEYWSRKLAECN